MGIADYGTERIPEGLAHRLAERFVELGGVWLDTAECYAFWVGELGTPDRIAGDLVRRHPSLKIIAKGAHVGMPPGYPRPDRFLTREIAEADLTESLRRMRLDRVDLWLFHRDDPRVPVEEIVEIGASFVLDGRAGAWGVSNWSGVRVQEAQSAAARAGLPGISVVENQWSMVRPVWTMDGTPGEVRWVTEEDEALFLDAGVQVAAYSPSAVGFFAGRERGDFDTPENRRVRDSLGPSPTRAALDWLRARPVPTFPILGTGNVEHLEEAMR